MINSEYFTNTKEKLFNNFKTELRLDDETLKRGEEILELAHKSGLVVGRCYATVITASVLLAVRERNVPRVADGFGEVVTENVKDIETKKIRSKARELKHKLGVSVKPTDKEKFLQYYLEDLNANDETKEIAEELLEAAEREDIAVNAAPNSIAAGVVDAARRLSGEEIVQDEIADVSHVSIPRFREYCHKMTNEV